MRTLFLGCMTIAAGILSTSSVLRPQDFDAGLDSGKAEYLANCANCHGADAKGTGPHGTTLKTKPADLTVLAKKNHGVFPVSQVYQLIDGRGARSHLSDEMPVWGCRQSGPRVVPQTHRRRHATSTVRRPSPNADLESFMNLACDPEQAIEQRIMSIVAYLSQIQAK